MTEKQQALNEIVEINDDKDCIETKSTAFLNSIKDLKQETVRQSSIDFLKNIHLDFEELDEETQELFFDTVYGLANKDIENFVRNSVLDDEKESLIESINHYLEIFNNDSFNAPSFRAKLIENCEFLFVLVRPILSEREKAKKKKQLPDAINNMLALALNLVDRLTHVYFEYEQEWQEHDLLDLMLRVSKAYRMPNIRKLVLSIVRNVFDYERLAEGDVHLELDYCEADTSDVKANKRTKAIGELAKHSEPTEMIRQHNFLVALRYIEASSQDAAFSVLFNQDEKNKLIKLLFSFVQTTHASMKSSIENRGESTNFEAKLMKTLTFLGFIFNDIFLPFIKSMEFRVLFQEQPGSISFLFELMKQKNLNEAIDTIDNNAILNTYYNLLKQSVEVLAELKHLANWYKKIWIEYDCEAVLSLIEEAKKIKIDRIDKDLLIGIIPFVVHYKDDKDDTQFKFLENYVEALNGKGTKEIQIQAMQLLIEYTTPEGVLHNRKALDALSLLRESSIEENYDIFETELMKKFIKLILNFVVYAKGLLDDDLQELDLESQFYERSSERIIQVAYFLNALLTILQNLADRSIDFCILFHDEANEERNNIKYILDLMSNENVITKVTKYSKNSIICSLMGFYESAFEALLNISKVADKFPDKWSKLNAFKVLDGLSNSLKDVGSCFQITSYLTIANIISDDELNNFSTSLSIIEIITQKVARFAQVLDVLKKKVKREEIQLHANDKAKTPIMTLDEWHLSELIQGLYRFAINDNIKALVYYNLNAKEWLKKILYNGNEAEQEYAFKLLYQFCFDKRIVDDVGKDTKLTVFMNSIVENKTTETRKNLIKYIEGTLWLINKANQKTEAVEESQKTDSKHIMISYNSESRPLCLSIKKELEAKGHKVWIDVEMIHGSSIDAMAQAVESAWCVLVCMTKKYKESPNCRLEAEYVIRLNKPFVPLIMQKGYKPDAWLGMMLGVRIFVDFTKYSFEDAMTKLTKELRVFNEVSLAKPPVKAPLDEAPEKPKNSDDSKDTVHAAKNATKVTHQQETDNATDEATRRVSQWTEAEVEKWLNEKRVSISIVSAITPCDGRVLEQLFKMSQDIPEFFFTTLRSDTKANLKEMALLSIELKLLFSNRNLQ